MKNIIELSLLTLIFFSCNRGPKTSTSVHTSPIDSLKITVTAFNLSEDVSGNDEVAILAYSYQDTLQLNEALFTSRLNFRAKNSSRQFKVKLNGGVNDKPLLLFFLEQDSELPLSKIDSTLRINHVAIRKLFAIKNYTALEKYIEDEDILGIKFIPALPYPQPYTIDFSGIYKLDKYQYQLAIECL